MGAPTMIRVDSKVRAKSQYDANFTAARIIVAKLIAYEHLEILSTIGIRFRFAVIYQ
jgi:hypothetical protein